jgi:hypothetical protein
MLDKELIAMCDTPEIQDRWEPKVGDRVASFTRINEEIDKDTYKRGRKYLDTVIISSPSQIEYRDLCVYIPRIEDVLEWIQNLSEEKFNRSRNNIDWRWLNVKEALKAYMHLEHNKTWNGEAWV